MPNDDKNRDDLLREIEIQNILEESHYLADQEQMEKIAQKYRAKKKMADIFSNADQKPRLKNDNPLDVDAEKANEPDTSNTIVGDKTAATMQAEIMMDGSDDNVRTPQQAEEEAKKIAEEKKAEHERLEAERKAKEEENKIVTLKPEFDKNTKISADILGSIDEFDDDRTHIESIHSIDIDINDSSIDDQIKAEEQEQKSKYEQLFGIKNSSDGKPPKKIVAKVPVYKPEEPRKILNVKAGRFSEVVAEEYEEYIRSKNPSVITRVIKNEPTKDEIETKTGSKGKRSVQEKFLSGLVGFFSNDESDDNDTPQEKSKPVEDYSGEEDEKSILYELNMNIKKLFIRSFVSGIIAAVAIVLTVITRLFPSYLCSAVSFAPAAYAVLNFLMVGLSIFINRVSILSGLTPLIKFKGNSDTAVAVGGVTALIQTIVSFFCLGDLTKFNINYYCVVVLIAFFANNVGKLLMVLRVKENFKFLTTKGQKYAAKIYNNESVANQMLSGTASDKALIAFQHKTDFASNFLKISYAPDPSEDLASKLAPITTIASIIIAVIYGVIKVSFSDAINALALITAVSIPVSTLVSVNLPIRRLCKKLLTFGAMISGYPSIKQFCDSTAIMIDANELFPADCIELEGIKTYEDYNVDESLLCGIAILKEAQNPIANAFDSVVEETNNKLPEVESVLYEDEMGLVGWINSERILVGSRDLMEKYNVETPRIEYEEKYTSEGKQVTYLSRAGRLIAMFVTRYHADTALKTELQRAETNGICFLIRTTDYNITNDLIAGLYNLFYRSIKVLPTGLGNVLKEAQNTHEESSRSYLITHGKVSSLSRAVSGSIKIKHNISLAVVIQLIAIVLAILLSATLSLYAGVGVMGSLEVLIYTLFWGAAAIIAPALQKT